MFILLDTTAILSDPLCAGTAWRVLAHAEPAWNLRVFVPEVVVAEAIAGYRRRITEALVGFQRWGDKHAGPLGLRSVREAAEAALEEAASSYPARLREALNDLNATVIKPPDVAHMVLVERAAARRRPCDADGNGYRDTLNWLTLLALASEYRDERIVWW
jgi:PIN domain